MPIKVRFMCLTKNPSEYVVATRKDYLNNNKFFGFGKITEICISNKWKGKEE
jgi:hypothetical protein